MQRIHPLLRFLLPLILLFATTPLLAQEVLLNDADRPSSYKPSTARKGPTTHSSAKTTAAAPFPFFDDFSYDSLAPASSHWVVPAAGTFARNALPGVSVRKGVAPPSKGVCTFDGATHTGSLYENELASGYGDSLLSLDFDLSLLGPDDSVYLSFFVQRGGSGDAPETSDSLILYFDSTGNYTYQAVWSMAGNGTAEQTFTYVEVPVLASYFFHDAFRFKFVNYGSLNGEFDIWHLDYVVFESGRFAGDNTFLDASPALIQTSPLAPWTAIPHDHFDLSPWMATPLLRVVNAGNPSMTVTANMTLSDPIGGTTLTGTLTQTTNSVNVPAFGNDLTAPATAFSEQTGNLTNMGALRLRSITSSAGDTRPQNDTLDFYCAVDSVLAYDDGVADAAYGMTVARSFCQEYRIPAADTLTAVWIYFTPYLYYNTSNGQSFSLESKNFRLSVWDTLVVDSFIVQTSSGMNVRYDSSLNAFHRYALNNPIVVDTTFWVGIRQVDQMPLGVGFDRNLNAAPFYYEAISGAFVPSTNQGSLMIRPEFARKRTISTGQQPAQELISAQLLAFPNPWNGGPLKLQLQNMGVPREATLKIMALDGSLLWNAAWPKGSQEAQLPSELSSNLSGMVLVQVSGTTSSGQPFVQTIRIFAAQ